MNAHKPKKPSFLRNLCCIKWVGVLAPAILISLPSAAEEVRRSGGRIAQVDSNQIDALPAPEPITSRLINARPRSAAEVRISGYGRFGLDANGGQPAASIRSRLRLQFDMSNESDGGLTFGAILRTRSIPRVSAGTQFNAGLGREVGISQSDKYLQGGGFKLGVIRGWGPSTVFVDATYSAFGNKNIFAAVPTGGNNVAFTYFTPNPATGSTGILFGLTGQDVSIQTSGREFEVSAGIDTPWEAALRYVSEFGGLRIAAGANTGSPPVNSNPFFIRVGAVVNGLNVEHSIRQQSRAFADHTMRTQLETQQFFVAPVIGVGANWGHPSFWFSLTGMVAPGILFANGTANQSVICPFCPLPGDRAFDQVQSSNKNWFSVKTSLEGRIGIPLAKNTSFQVSVRADHYSRTAYLSNPITPAEGPARLLTKSSYGFSGTFAFLRWF